mmetsp:Transcript_170355/g.414102  ORF Transcript_170355/g.414102 Transcript_170355/m.414102 type:complete len:311 (+) Transcript_170355:99-1031(+)
MSCKAPELLLKHSKLFAHDGGESGSSEGSFINVPMIDDAHKLSSSHRISQASTEQPWSTYEDKESLPLPSSNYRYTSSRRASGPATLRHDPCAAPRIDLSEMMRRRRHSADNGQKEDIFRGLPKYTTKYTRDKGAPSAAARHLLGEYSNQDADDDGADNCDGSWSQLDSDSEDDSPRVARQSLVLRTSSGREPPQLLRLGDLHTAVCGSSKGDCMPSAHTCTPLRKNVRKISLLSVKTQAGDDSSDSDGESSADSRNTWQGIPDLNASLDEKHGPIPSQLLLRRPQFSSPNLRVCTSKLNLSQRSSACLP